MGGELVGNNRGKWHHSVRGWSLRWSEARFATRRGDELTIHMSPAAQY
jgi:acyl dehydratase